MEFSDYILLGTKNEIISHIYNEYNSLLEDYKKIDKNYYIKLENDYNNLKQENNELLDSIEQEKLVNKDLGSKISELENKQKNKIT